jgi:hypothetical protein
VANKFDYPIGFKALTYDIYSKAFVSPLHPLKWNKESTTKSDGIPRMNNSSGIYLSYDYNVAYEYISKDHSGDSCIFLIAAMSKLVFHTEGLRCQEAVPIAAITGDFSRLGAWYFNIQEIEENESIIMVQEYLKESKQIKKKKLFGNMPDFFIQVSW